MQKNIFFILIYFVLFQLTIGAAPFASQKEPSLTPIERKVMAIVERTKKFITTHSGDMKDIQQALMNDPKFSDRENGLYIFMHYYDKEKGEAICCGQGVRPDLIGKNMWNLRTPNGRLLFQEFAKMIEKEGKGWIEYEWLNPFLKKIQTKKSFAMGITLKNGRKAWVGCGYWKTEKN